MERGATDGNVSDGAKCLGSGLLVCLLCLAQPLCNLVSAD